MATMSVYLLMYKMLHAKFVSMFVICLHTTFNMSISNGSLFITILHKIKYRFY
jgi:hypothetical protein